VAKMSWATARKKSGLAKFERTHRRKTAFRGRQVLAYKVPGTTESGQRDMLSREARDLMNRENPSKFRQITQSTGWLRASAVRFIKKAGKPVQVLVRRTRNRSRRTKKR